MLRHPKIPIVGSVYRSLYIIRLMLSHDHDHVTRTRRHRIEMSLASGLIDERALIRDQSGRAIRYSPRIVSHIETSENHTGLLEYIPPDISLVRVEEGHIIKVLGYGVDGIRASGGVFGSVVQDNYVCVELENLSLRDRPRLTGWFDDRAFERGDLYDVPWFSWLTFDGTLPDE